MLKLKQGIFKNQFRSGFFISTAVTLFLILVYLAAVKIPIPFLTDKAIKEFFYSDFTYSTEIFSIFSLGLMPYVSAYISVEILSLVVPYLKKFRKGDLNGRRKLKAFALLLTLFLGIIQARGIINGLLEMRLPNGEGILNLKGDFDLILLTALLAGGVYFLIILCELISRYGIGNGISLILLAGICTGFFNSLNRTFPIYDELGLGLYLFSGSVLCALVVVIVFLLKSRSPVKLEHRLKNAPMKIFHINFCPSAMGAKTWAASVVMIPATLSAFWGADYDTATMFAPGSISYGIASVVFIFIFSNLLALAFFHPRRRLKKYKEMGWEFPGAELKTEAVLRKRLLIYNLPWTLFLCVLAIMPYFLISSFNLPFYLGGASIPFAVAISLDIIDRCYFEMTSQEDHVRIARFNDVYDAGMIKYFLSAEGVPCHLQGYYHRHLYYFFGPHIEIELIVSNSKKELAIELLDRYFGGIGR